MCFCQVYMYLCVGLCGNNSDGCSFTVTWILFFILFYVFILLCFLAAGVVQTSYAESNMDGKKSSIGLRAF